MSARSDPLVCSASTTSLLYPLSLGLKGGNPLLCFYLSLITWKLPLFIAISALINLHPKRNDYVYHTVRSGIRLSISTSPQSSDSGMCSYPLSLYYCNDKFSTHYKAFLTTITIDVEPLISLRLSLIYHGRRPCKVKTQAFEINNT